MDKSYLAAYAAGLFDGDGWIGLHELSKPGRRPVFHFTAGITMTDLKPLRLLAAIFGGAICQPKQRPGRSQLYQWSMRSHTAEAFFRAVLPWSQVKHARIKNALRFYLANERDGSGFRLTRATVAHRSRVVSADRALTKAAYKRMPKS